MCLSASVEHKKTSEIQRERARRKRSACVCVREEEKHIRERARPASLESWCVDLISENEHGKLKRARGGEEGSRREIDEPLSGVSSTKNMV